MKIEYSVVWFLIVLYTTTAAADTGLAPLLEYVSIPKKYIRYKSVPQSLHQMWSPIA